MCFGESLYYTDVDYKWLESEISWAGVCVDGGGQRTFPSYGLSLTKDLIK
jgi:hypothetical protein